MLTDLSMPDISGYEATQAIHAHPRGKNIPVVAVSADYVDFRYEKHRFQRRLYRVSGEAMEEESSSSDSEDGPRGGVKLSECFQHT